MATARIILWLGNAFVFCAVLMFLGVLSGFALGESRLAGQFGFLTLIISFLGGLLVFTTRKSFSQEGTKDALIFLLLFWLFTPAILALPYWVSEITPNYSQAYFESVSAFTTTGASTLTPEQTPRTFLLWRSMLQWGGGVIAATFAIVILAALNLSGTGVHRSKLFTLRKGQLFTRILGIGRVVALVYALIAAACFAGLLLSGSAVFESLCLSLSAISTGGLMPFSPGVSKFVSPFGALVLAIVCLLGASNIAVLWDVVRLQSLRSVRKVFVNIEHRGLFALLAVFIIIGAFYAGIGNMFGVIIESAFFVSNTGFHYDVIGIDILPPALLIAAALIGGSAVSTAGGIKIIRMILLLRHAGTDLDRMSHPSRVKLVKFKSQTLPDRAFMSVWMYFLGYTLVFAGGILALGLVQMDYTIAVSAAAGSLSNMGPLLSYTFPMSTYAQMSDGQLTILSVLMLLGRVEVLAALAIFSPSLWRQ